MRQPVGGRALAGVVAFQIGGPASQGTHGLRLGRQVPVVLSRSVATESAGKK